MELINWTDRKRAMQRQHYGRPDTNLVVFAFYRFAG
jgi:hypothetical protein